MIIIGKFNSSLFNDIDTISSCSLIQSSCDDLNIMGPNNCGDLPEDFFCDYELDYTYYSKLYIQIEFKNKSLYNRVKYVNIHQLSDKYFNEVLFLLSSEFSINLNGVNKELFFDVVGDFFNNMKNYSFSIIKYLKGINSFNVKHESDRLGVNNIFKLLYIIKEHKSLFYDFSIPEVKGNSYFLSENHPKTIIPGDFNTYDNDFKININWSKNRFAEEFKYRGIKDLIKLSKSSRVEFNYHSRLVKLCDKFGFKIITNLSDFYILGNKFNNCLRKNYISSMLNTSNNFVNGFVFEFNHDGVDIMGHIDNFKILKYLKINNNIDASVEAYRVVNKFIPKLKNIICSGIYTDYRSEISIDDKTIELDTNLPHESTDKLFIDGSKIIDRTYGYIFGGIDNYIINNDNNFLLFNSVSIGHTAISSVINGHEIIGDNDPQLLNRFNENQLLSMAISKMSDIPYHMIVNGLRINDFRRSLRASNNYMSYNRISHEINETYDEVEDIEIHISFTHSALSNKIY